MKDVKMKPRKGYRSIEVAGKEYLWKSGKNASVKIYGPNGASAYIEPGVISQKIDVYTYCECCNEVDKIYQEDATLPNAVAKYIKEHNL